jgi:pullulanase/glycogen debranching enzyme
MLRSLLLALALVMLFAQPRAHGADADNGALAAQCDADTHATLLAASPAGPALESRALWLNRRWLRWPDAPGEGRFKLYHSADAQIIAIPGNAVRGAEASIHLTPTSAALPAALRERFKWVTGGAALELAKRDTRRVGELLRGQLVLVQEDANGRVLRATGTQIAGALDDLYAAAEEVPDLGATIAGGRTQFKLWAPTAQSVVLCRHASGSSAASAVHAMQRDPRTGVWSLALDGDLGGSYYTFLVDVVVAGVGLVRNRVTDPYSLSLSTDSRRSYVADLDAAALKPAGWDKLSAPKRVQHATDMAIYELHVRDFSINDASVPAALRGKFLAFDESDSNGMRHLRALAEAGITDIHLLPSYDLSTVPEVGCVTPAPEGAPDSEAQQAAVEAVKARDCFNWGYDPFHYTAPEGSYATDPADGAVRVREFRAMVAALHRAGLRVGMDVVYNHTFASGQDPKSVLDRIVPGYYHRLDAAGRVERSTCCENTATENRMMAKLMIDSAVVWAREHRIDSFRFDLMGHQPRAVMERLRDTVNAAAGREVQLLGEGWNFGEIRDGARFVQASQLSLNGSGIGTFSDRARDAARGGGAGDNGVDQVARQGWLNGLFHDRNAFAPVNVSATDLMRAADLIRVGLAGSLRDFRLRAYNGETGPLSRIVYGGNQPAGYVSEPGEVVNYVENHDNQTLYDLNAFKLPVATGSADRARVQVLGAAIVAFSQGIAYFHAGQDVLRSKSMDRNSYDSGDWFNRLDWSYRDNYFGTGLPPRADNERSWPWMRAPLADPALKPRPEDIAFARDAFRDLLRIRYSTPLFRLRTAAEVSARLSFPGSGPEQQATVLVGHLDGSKFENTRFRELLYFLSADRVERTLVLPEHAGKPWSLHPVHASGADPRPRQSARAATEAGRFTVPPRTALVWVLE